MGLTANGILNGFSGRLRGVAQGAFAPGMMNTILAAHCFGSGGITSIPQGYTIPTKALRMTMKVSGNISARFSGEFGLIGHLVATGNMGGILDAESFFTAEGNVALNGYATFAGEFDMEGSISALGSMAANMDLIARPSANDIAQEVWNSRIAAFQSAGTLGKSLSEAEAAAKLGAALSA